MFVFLSLPGFGRKVIVHQEIASRGVVLTGEVGHYVDSDGTGRPNDLQFSSESGKVISEALFPFSRSDHWLRFSIRNTGPERSQCYLLIDNYRIEELKVYMQKPDTLIEFSKVGWGTPLIQRPYPHYKNVFPFDIAYGGELTFYIRTSSRYQPHNVPVVLTGHQDLTNAILVTTLSDGFILVLSLFLFLLSVYLWYDSGGRGSVYFWYCFYSLGTFLFWYIRAGVQYFNEAPLSPFLQYIAEIFSVCNLLSYTAFGLVFMSPGSITPLSFRLFQRAVLATAGIAALSYFIPPMPNPQLIFTTRAIQLAVSIFALLYMLSAGLRNREKEAYIFLVMFIPLFAGYILLMLATDIFPRPSAFDRSLLMKFLIFFESAVMMFSVFYKSGRIKRELFQKVADSEKQMLYTQVRVEESERERIASNLHDQLGANLAIVKRDLAELRKMSVPVSIKQIITRIETVVAETGEEIRRITHNLMPPNFEKIGLKDSLRYLTERAGTRDLHFEFTVFGNERSLGREVELNLYRVISELIHNIHKHSAASMASVQMVYFEDKLTILVEDNGCGFETGATDSYGIGLYNMRLRAGYIGADLFIDSGKGGTSVILEFRYR